MGIQDWLTEHLLFTYLIIFAMIAFVYNTVFRVSRLPILKNVAVHLIIAVGSALLWFFQLAQLPIVQSLSVAIALMVIYRLRVFYLARTSKSKTSDKGGTT